ncbi:hypothetical protein ZIOFF_054687 [Zingiber officinale]|uniref:Potassium channel tetramerisation-type BTB domain-containing protein n=1 Tax=Zingiber officinale TaxID=94328 RepID=A0A8J5FES4_ZINOF|nr:hypothetical protein ZIOFF_054687 [Zingiber officinale]
MNIKRNVWKFGLRALDDSWNVQQPEEAEYFINCNPTCFARLLNLLLTGKLHIQPNMTEKLLFHEALFYGLLNKLRRALQRVQHQDKKHALHANIIEETHSICFVNQYDDLNFIDSRSHASSVWWSSRSNLTNWKAPNEESCYPKPPMHDDQLFSMNGSISIFYGPMGAKRMTGENRVMFTQHVISV